METLSQLWELLHNAYFRRKQAHRNVAFVFLILVVQCCQLWERDLLIIIFPLPVRVSLCPWGHRLPEFEFVVSVFSQFSSNQFKINRNEDQYLSTFSLEFCWNFDILFCWQFWTEDQINKKCVNVLLCDFVEITLYCLKHQTSVYLVHIGIVDRIYRNCSCLVGDDTCVSHLTQ